MSRFILDDHLRADRVRDPILRWATAQYIRDVRPGEVVKDDRILMVLRALQTPTFLTLDDWFENPVRRDPRYCILYFALRHDEQGDIPTLLRRLLRLPEFRTRAARTGKVARVSCDHVSWWQIGDEREYTRARSRAPGSSISAGGRSAMSVNTPCGGAPLPAAGVAERSATASAWGAASRSAARCGARAWTSAVIFLRAVTEVLPGRRQQPSVWLSLVRNAMFRKRPRGPLAKPGRAGPPAGGVRWLRTVSPSARGRASVGRWTGRAPLPPVRGASRQGRSQGSNDLRNHRPTREPATASESRTWAERPNIGSE